MGKCIKEKMIVVVGTGEAGVGDLLGAALGHISRSCRCQGGTYEESRKKELHDRSKSTLLLYTYS